MIRCNLLTLYQKILFGNVHGIHMQIIKYVGKYQKMIMNSNLNLLKEKRMPISLIDEMFVLKSLNLVEQLKDALLEKLNMKIVK